MDTIKVNGQFIKTESPRKYFYQNDPAINELKREFAKTPFRVFAWRGTFPMQNQEGVYGLEGVSGFNDNELNCYRQFRGDQGDINYLQDIAVLSANGNIVPSMARIMGNTPFLDIANVEYILMVLRPGSIDKVKNPTALGRLSYASGYAVMDSAEAIIDGLRSMSYDYRTKVALLEEPELPFTLKNGTGDDDKPSSGNIDSANGDIVGADGNRPETGDDVGAEANRPAVDNPATPAKPFAVDWKKYTTNKRIANITMPADGFLRISEVYYPGWRITINGESRKYYRSDVAWMAVPLAAGDYEVIMEPKSLFLDTAILVSLAFVLMTVLILGLGFLRKRKMG
jgi:hypothetical protein